MSVCPFVLRGSVLIVVLATPVVIDDGQEAGNPELVIDTGMLKTGDLIFRRGKSIASRLVLLADKESAYSHVGLLLMDQSEALVIHIVPAETNGEPGQVQVDLLASFIDARHNSAVSVRRLKHVRAGHYGSVAGAVALTYVRDALPFDDRFNLESADRMYCTELVWRAYLKAGIDLVDGVFVRVQTPFGEGRYVLPSSLLNSRYLREIVSLAN